MFIFRIRCCTLIDSHLRHIHITKYAGEVSDSLRLNASFRQVVKRLGINRVSHKLVNNPIRGER